MALRVIVCGANSINLKEVIMISKELKVLVKHHGMLEGTIIIKIFVKFRDAVTSLIAARKYGSTK